MFFFGSVITHSCTETSDVDFILISSASIDTDEDYLSRVDTMLTTCIEAQFTDYDLFELSDLSTLEKSEKLFHKTIRETGYEVVSVI